MRRNLIRNSRGRNGAGRTVPTSRGSSGPRGAARAYTGEPFRDSCDRIGPLASLGQPLHAGCRLLADSVASLPVKIYTHPTERARAVRYYGPSILDAPSAAGTIYD